MTVFDRLEAQLLDAHPHRARRAFPRPAPRRIVAFAAAAFAVAVIAVAALSAGSSTSSPTPTAHVTSTPAFDPSSTTVAVLNATRKPGAARDVAVELQRRGWKIGNVTNAPDQALAASHIESLGSRTHMVAMLRLARQLGIHSVAPASPSVTLLAGETADVVVVVGAR
jgi:negative regulator of sigma E activity